MNTILRFKPNAMRKSDFKALFEHIIQIVEKYNPSGLHLEHTYLQVKQVAPLADKLIVTTRKNRLTAEVVNLRDRLNRYVASMRLQVKAMLKYDDEETILAATRLQLILKSLFSYFDKRSYPTQQAMILQFFSEVDNDKVLKSAMETLNLIPLYDKMAEVETELYDVYARRRVSNSSRPLLQTETNKRTLYSKLSQLFLAIEAAQIEYPELDYESLVGELNVVIREQLTSDAIRAGKRKAKTS